MAEEFIIKLVNSDVADAAGGAASGGGVSPIAAGAGLAGGFALLGELISIVKDAVSNVLKPLRALVVGIMKTIVEFLRPIVDILVIALQPVLNIIKPFLQLFKAFMSPFIDIARQMSSIAQQQVAGGDIAGGMKTSLDAINIILGPFVISLVSVALQLATSLLVSGITLVLDNILAVIQSTFALLPDWIGGRAVEALQTARDALSDGSQALITSINTTLTKATTDLLADLEGDALKKLAEAKDAIKDLSDQAYIETPAGAIADAAAIIKTSADGLAKDVGTAANNMDIAVTGSLDPVDGVMVTTLNTGLTAMEKSVSEFSGQLQVAAEEINAIRIKSVSERAGSSVRKVVRFLGINTGVTVE